MKLCPKCNKSLWPFVMVFYVGGIGAFITWLTLAYSQFSPDQQVAGSALIFLAVGGTVLHYVLGCLRRHCRHDRHVRQDGDRREAIG